jgi:hypothetical protein
MKLGMEPSQAAVIFAPSNDQAFCALGVFGVFGRGTAV